MVTYAEHDLLRATPEQMGVPSSALLEFIQAVGSQIQEFHSFMLLRHGSVIAEGWWSPYQPEHPHMMFSLSKSFTSTAVGLAVAEGHFSMDDLVLSFFPDDAPADVSEFLAGMRVRHLLSMSTGHSVDTWAPMLDRSDGNWIKGFLAVPVSHTPGTHFLYNTGATYMLAAIVQKTTGVRLIEYLTPRLFEPLGIKQATWEESPQGIAKGGIGLSITTEDIARFGQLYLQNGLWQGTQLLSEAWIKEATQPQISNGNNPDSDWTQGYGYQFWRCRHNAYRGDGAFGQYCIVMPDQDAVLAITGGVDVFDMQPPLDLVWKILLPAMGSEPLAEDAASQQRLTETLANLTRPSVQGKASSPLVSQISGRTYAVDANGLNLEHIALNFAESDCTLKVKTASGEETIPCGYGVWLKGQTSLFDNRETTGAVSVAVSGAWTSEDRFTMIVRLYETPFFYTFVFDFVDDEMMIEAQVNVSFDSMKPLLFTAHPI